MERIYKLLIGLYGLLNLYFLTLLLEIGDSLKIVFQNVPSFIICFWIIGIVNICLSAYGIFGFILHNIKVIEKGGRK